MTEAQVEPRREGPRDFRQKKRGPRLRFSQPRLSQKKSGHLKSMLECTMSP